MGAKVCKLDLVSDSIAMARPQARRGTSIAVRLRTVRLLHAVDVRFTVVSRDLYTEPCTG